MEKTANANDIKAPESAPMSYDQLAELEALLNDEPAQEATPEGFSNEAVEAAVEELELEEAKKEALAKQDEKAQKKTRKRQASSKRKASKKEEPAKEATPKPVKKEKAPRQMLTGMKPSEVVKLIGGGNWKEMVAFDVSDAGLSAADLDSKIEARLTRADGLNKKQQERVVNVFKWMGGAKLRNYTDIAIAALVEKGKLTSVELKEAYTSKHKAEKTANSQVSNYMHVLPALEIAIKTDSGLELNPNSTIVELWKSQQS